MVHERTVYFLRHGMTESNQKKQYCGWLDTPLLHSQRQLLSERAGCLCAEEVWTSDLQRAVQTAALLFPHAVMNIHKDLRELYFGHFEGKTYEELKSSPAYRRWIEDFEHQTPLGGESLAAFRQRIHASWTEMTTKSRSNMAVVTHSGWIREWCRMYLSKREADRRWHIPYGGGLAITFRIEGGEWKCISLQEVHVTEKNSG
ncbi:alpha-ribazole phosphatase [Alteribacillus persepolensis]|uniref:Alpha-ribazole phosphatase n=1 Tax=Alteribacillus persepolensis TaxID=568899 RepID=A0A1G7ZKA7_9BACI|nr:histidine phosphatase family protein [Alteribacillus persepolensis]SDH09201.1 alpha-ribazole phosphatase [Alteribacillus persepolensis]